MVGFVRKTVLWGMASLWVCSAWGGTTTAKPRVSTWNVDKPHSKASFSVRHMGLAKVTGGLTGMTGQLMLDEKDVEKSKITVTIPVASINTNHPKRDAHLVSPDFFYAEKYPHITFTSTKVQQLKPGSRELNICGWLEIRGKRNQECFVGRLNGPQQYPTGKWGLGFETTKPDFISRKAYGVGTKFPGAAGSSVSERILTFAKTAAATSLIDDNIGFELNVELIQQEDSAKKKR